MHHNLHMLTPATCGSLLIELNLMNRRTTGKNPPPRHWQPFYSEWSRDQCTCGGVTSQRRLTM